MTLEENRKKKGGNPEECSVFELMLFHLLEDDNELLEVKQECIQEGGCAAHASNLQQKRYMSY